MTDEVRELSAAELKVRLAETENPVILLDVREPFELAQGVIPGAVCIPMNAVPDNLHELDSQQEIIVYCAHGIRSYHVAAFLMERGYRRVASLADGYAGWEYHNWQAK